MSLQDYIDKFGRLNIDVAHGRASPHKICMLLALLDLARSGALARNEIRFLAPLLERYCQYFDAVRATGNTPNPWMPFFHLQGRLRGGEESFWHLKALPGREQVLAAMSTARKFSDITGNVDYAFLDDELFFLLQREENVEALSTALADKWFSRGLAELGPVVSRGKAISRYEHLLRGLEQGRADVRDVPAPIRDPAFRRVVTEIYEYRCAATGVKLVLPDGRAMVEAAHIKPFAISHDDDPRNGLALTPDMHWAMDECLIAPTPDYRWRVSGALDDGNPEHRFLINLQDKPVLLPKEERWRPRQDTLEWRLSRLL